MSDNPRGGVYNRILFSQLRQIGISVDKVVALLRNPEIRNVGQALDAMEDPIRHRWAPDNNSLADSLENWEPNN